LQQRLKARVANRGKRMMEINLPNQLKIEKQLKVLWWKIGAYKHLQEATM
jgi:hypothetical protein